MLANSAYCPKDFAAAAARATTAQMRDAVQLEARANRAMHNAALNQDRYVKSRQI
jgi:hypothetical protein